MRREQILYINKKRAVSLFATLLIVAAVSVPATLAYFSDYAKATGEKDVHLAWQTELIEDVIDNDKHITIENAGETPVIVRVQVFAGADLASVSGDAWLEGSDGWWYYNKILGAGQTISKEDELLVDVKAAEELTESDFNIIVVHESSRVVYKDNSTLAAPEGWDETAVGKITVQ